MSACLAHRQHMPSHTLCSTTTLRLSVKNQELPASGQMLMNSVQPLEGAALAQLYRKAAQPH